MSAIILGITLSLWLLKFISPNLRIEAYSGLVLECLMPAEDTEYVPGYSHKRFLGIFTWINSRFNHSPSFPPALQHHNNGVENNSDIQGDRHIF